MLHLFEWGEDGELYIRDGAGTVVLTEKQAAELALFMKESSDKDGNLIDRAARTRVE